MSKSSTILTLLTIIATTTIAQGPGAYGGGSGGGSFGNGGTNNDGDGDSGSSDNPLGNGDSSSEQDGDMSHLAVVLIAHAILATLSFAFFMPIGGILIRIASFNGLWWVHALVESFGHILYIAAFGAGVWLVTQSPPELNLLHSSHVIVGIAIFVVLSFQPVLGYVHHLMFVRHARRTIWSWAHIWHGRIIITLGIINGCLGLELGRRVPLVSPSRASIIGYGVAAGVMWLAYVGAIFVGNRRRARRGRRGSRNLERGRREEKGSVIRTYI